MKAKKGVVTPVKNTERKFGSDLNYEAVWVERNGLNTCLMGTENAFDELEYTALKNPEDIPVPNNSTGIKSIIFALVIGAIIGAIITIIAC